MFGRDDVYRRLQDAGISFRQVLIPGIDDRLTHITQSSHQSLPTAIVILPGDVFAVKIALDLLLQKLNQQLVLVPLIWINTGDYWENLFQYLDFPVLTRRLDSLRVIVLENIDNIAAYLPASCSVYEQVEIPLASETHLQGSTITNSDFANCCLDRWSCANCSGAKCYLPG